VFAPANKEHCFRAVRADMAAGAILGVTDMNSTFKTLVLATAAASLFAAGPALARTKHRLPANQAQNSYLEVPGAYVNPADPYVVTDGANYLGRDPGAQIRGELLKDDTVHNGNAY
jgi:hypothetical protein